MKTTIALGCALLSFLSGASAFADSSTKTKFVSINAHTREERTRLLELGINIEEVYSDRVWSLVSDQDVKRAIDGGFKVLTEAPSEVFFRGREIQFGKNLGKGPQFPSGDEKFHDFSDVKIVLAQLQKKNPRITRLETIGKSWEGRDLIALHINASMTDLENGHSSKPGVAFMGAHHAREHLTVEVPLMLAEYLLDHQNEAAIAQLIASRDIWIIPMVNPDGAEFDIDGGSYHMWRKNRRNNGDSNWGVDLNRNFGYQWGTGGSSTSTGSDTYMGPEAFSEPESKAVRDFISDHLNIKMLLSYHSYSELILYPWGHSYSPISNQRDQQVFSTMAQTMSRWNGYKPQQSSALYIASGDTTDWAYGAYGVFAFTFELTPKNMFGGGFYPGAKVIDSTFKANLNPALYMIDLADNPYRAIDQGPGASIWYK
jgi:carboxypeptidase T